MYVIYERVRALVKFLNVDTVISQNQFSNKQVEFIKYLNDNTDASYIEALHFFYGGNKKESFNRFLNRIESIVINGGLLANSIVSLKGEAFYKSISTYKSYASLQIIRESGNEKLYVHYAEKILRRAITNQMLDLVMILSSQLEFHYSFIEIDTVKEEKYRLLKNSTTSTLTVINELSLIYYKLGQLIVSGKSVRLIDVTEEYICKLQKAKKLINYNTPFTVAQRIYASLSYYFLLTQEYSKMYVVSKESYEYFKINFPDRALQHFLFRLRMAVAKIFMSDYNGARRLMNEVLEMNPSPGLLHWNSAYSYAFVLEMLTKNYQDATDILIDMVTEPKLNNLEDIWIQQWRIRSAYIHFLAKIGLVDLERIGKKRVPNFRLGRFLNEVPTYSKDKRGLNISIIIAQFLILLADRKFGQIYDRIDALSKYSYRHLKNDDKLRSNCFIRMLLSLAKAEFNPVRAQRYAEKYVEKLKTTEMNLNEYSTEIEIIPYEDLWEIILQLVDQKKKVNLT